MLIVTRTVTRECYAEGGAIAMRAAQGRRPSLCVVKGSGDVETFIRAHAEGQPADITLIHDLPPRIDGRPILSQARPSRARRKTLRLLTGREWSWELTTAYQTAFRRTRAEAVLAEFGQTGVTVSDACRRLGIPLIVHFHGADISKRAVLDEYGDRYRILFREARAIVAVSEAMRQRLIECGAPPDKVHRNPYGVNVHSFQGASPATADPVFLAVGRFVEKKAPQLTILAFADVHRRDARARLRMIGTGPLVGACRDLARGLGIDSVVSFLGAQPPHVIQDEMRQARAFVQHSIEAASGDAEGMPVAILEAAGSGLPVVATRHAGIPEAVIDGETGFLVDEHDVAGMAAAMSKLVCDPTLAARLGTAGRDRATTHFSAEQSLARLWSIIAACLTRAE
jgi:glycosyltransferase involved in cell wall biosynthesis